MEGVKYACTNVSSIYMEREREKERDRVIQTDRQTNG